MEQVIQDAIQCITVGFGLGLVLSAAGYGISILLGIIHKVILEGVR